MIRLIENISQDSEIAYFVSFEKDAQEPEVSQPNFDVVRYIQRLLGTQGQFPDVDLIITATEEGIVKKSQIHLLHRHLGALDAPLDDFAGSRHEAVHRGVITENESEAACEAASVDWRQYEVFDATGVLCEVDEAGNPQPAIFTYFDEVDREHNVEYQVAQAMGLNSYIYQAELDWSNGTPILREYNDSPDFVAHTTLGITDPSETTFQPVVSVPDRSHPIRTK